MSSNVSVRRGGADSNVQMFKLNGLKAFELLNICLPKSTF